MRRSRRVPLWPESAGVRRGVEQNERRMWRRREGVPGAKDARERLRGLALRRGFLRRSFFWSERVHGGKKCLQKLAHKIMSLKEDEEKEKKKKMMVMMKNKINKNKKLENRNKEKEKIEV